MALWTVWCKVRRRWALCPFQDGVAVGDGNDDDEGATALRGKMLQYDPQAMFKYRQTLWWQFKSMESVPLLDELLPPSVQVFSTQTPHSQLMICGVPSAHGPEMRHVPSSFSWKDGNRTWRRITGG